MNLEQVVKRCLEDFKKQRLTEKNNKSSVRRSLPEKKEG